MDNEILINNTIKQHNDKLIVYGDNQIVLIEDLNNDASNLPMRIDMVIGILCLKGNATCNINGNTIIINAGDMLVQHPNAIFSNSRHSDDIEFRGICLSRDYVKQLATMPRNIWDIILHIEESPIVHLQEAEMHIFLQYYNLLKAKLLSKPGINHKEIINSLTQAVICEIQDVFVPHMETDQLKYTSSNMLFSRFLELLSSSAPREREVSYYANHLFVSPKYLSAVCKEISGKTASEIISSYTVKEITRLLKMNTMSIKEIAYRLNFSSISFFGKYVRKHLGMSPKHYREYLIRNDN